MWGRKSKNDELQMRHMYWCNRFQKEIDRLEYENRRLKYFVDHLVTNLNCRPNVAFEDIYPPIKD